MSRKKYEYRVENINYDNMGFYDYIYEIERILNKHGENGWELDKMEFYIPETKETIKAKQRPIVIITSNAEKELPDAFLRRCIFHYIEFPDAEQMEEIIKVHFDHVEENVLKQVLATFYWIRGLYNIQKKPSTSEVIDWIRALELGGVPSYKIKETVPFAGVLLKKNEDIDTMRKYLK